MGTESENFVSEFKHRRDISGLSQTALAVKMGYHRTYISKIENGQERATREFADAADEVLEAGGALKRAYREAQPRVAGESRVLAAVATELTELSVEHDHATLEFDGFHYRATQKRQLYNGGTEPISRYLVRISVDRYPGEPERSNQLYRSDPLTWDELELRAEYADGEPMIWTVQHDRDAFKELWLRFENKYGQFPIYPGETAWITYSYRVSRDKWGNWFQRAIRLPTQRVTVVLDFPQELKTRVWGTELTMTAAANPLRNPIEKNNDKGRDRFTWSTADPPLHARFRLQWSFPQDRERKAELMQTKPSEVMSRIGIVQDTDPQLTDPVRPLNLPEDAEDARRIVAELATAMDRVRAVHDFTKGMGIAAPQIGIQRAVALVRTPDGQTLTLLNPVIIEESSATDEQYEGCLSFFDWRGKVPRSLSLHVEHLDIGGSPQITVFDHGLARLVAHEIDHLNGTLYRDRMRPGAEPISVEEYRGTGTTWTYDRR
jgi:peptide deformylase